MSGVIISPWQVCAACATNTKQIAELERALRGSSDGQPALRKKRRISAVKLARTAEAKRWRWEK